MTYLDRFIRLQDTARLFHVRGEVVINRSGIEIRFPDEDRFVVSLLRALDGSVSLRDAYASLAPEVTGEHELSHADDVITQLEPLSLFEDADLLKVGRAAMSDYQFGRWNRNLDFFAAYCGLDRTKYDIQKTISDAKVVLLGVGGVGTHALLDLVSLGFTNIRAVDFDKIELSNLNRQILYRESDVGRPKIEAAKEAIERYISPDRHNIQFERIYIDGPDIAQRLVAGADVVVACVDRPTNVVSWINEGCVREGVPLVTGGVDTTRTTTYTILPGSSGCVECWRQGLIAAGEASQELFEQELARDVLVLPPRPAIVNLVAIHVGFLMSEVLKIVTELSPPSATDRLVQFDFASMQTSVPETWTRRHDCPVCGSTEARVAAE